MFDLFDTPWKAVLALVVGVIALAAILFVYGAVAELVQTPSRIGWFPFVRRLLLLFWLLACLVLLVAVAAALVSSWFDFESTRALANQAFSIAFWPAVLAALPSIWLLMRWTPRSGAAQLDAAADEAAPRS